MASTASPYGLRLAKSQAERRMGHGFSQYPILSGYAADLKCGDLVKLVIGGTIQKETGTTTTSAGVIGVFMGVSYTDPSFGFVQKQQWVSGTVTQNAANAFAYVMEDPSAIFQIQANGSLSQNAVGTNAALVQGTGNLTLGVSGVALNAGSIAVTSTLPIRIVGLVNEVGFSVPGDAFTDVLVKLNNHFDTQLTGNSPT
jgi:hypothetical protein